VRGGLALIYPDGFISMHRTPVKKYRSGRRLYLVDQMCELIEEHHIGLAAIEHSSARDGRATTNRFGLGVWTGILFANHIRCIGVFTPTWRDELLVHGGQELDDPRACVDRLFPRRYRHRNHDSRRPSDGAVIAACLAEHASRYVQFEAEFANRKVE
jgi:hypothetical protein